MTAKETIHALTTAEIARQIRQFNERRRQITDERAAIYAASVKSGVQQSPIVNEDERAARELAKRLLNGSAPESLSLAPEISRDRLLFQEQRAIDIVLKVLSDQNLAAQTVEAVAWGEEHRDEWRALCRDIVLSRVRLDALEQRAHELLATCIDVTAVRLPMSFVVSGRSVGEIPAGELITAALAEDVVSEAEIRKAKKC